jgi:hypothetical protein
MAAGQRHPDAGGVVGGVPRFAQNGGEVVAARQNSPPPYDEQRTGDARGCLLSGSEMSSPTISISTL